MRGLRSSRVRENPFLALSSKLRAQNASGRVHEKVVGLAYGWRRASIRRGEAPPQRPGLSVGLTPRGGVRPHPTRLLTPFQCGSILIAQFHGRCLDRSVVVTCGHWRSPNDGELSIGSSHDGRQSPYWHPALDPPLLSIGTPSPIEHLPCQRSAFLPAGPLAETRIVSPRALPATAGRLRVPSLPGGATGGVTASDDFGISATEVHLPLCLPGD